MRRLFDSDLAFYAAVGAFITGLFLVGLAVLAAINPDSIEARELGGFVVGFGLFMFSYVTAMVIYRVVPDDIDAS